MLSWWWESVMLFKPVGSCKRTSTSVCCLGQSVFFFSFTGLFLILSGLQELSSFFSHYSFILAAVPLELVILIRLWWRGEILLKCNCSLMAFPLWHCVGRLSRWESAGFAAWLRSPEERLARFQTSAITPLINLHSSSLVTKVWK